MNVEEIKAALAKVTPELWQVVANLDDAGNPNGLWFVRTDDHTVVSDDISSIHDAALIANAKRWLSVLIAEVERLRTIAADYEASDAFRKGIDSVLRIRCLKHRKMPQMNCTVDGGAECAVCATDAASDTNKTVKVQQAVIEELNCRIAALAVSASEARRREREAFLAGAEWADPVEIEHIRIAGLQDLDAEHDRRYPEVPS